MVAGGDERVNDEVAEELRKLRKTLQIGIIAYVVFWGIVIALIHLVMIPAIKGG